ncbi:ferredoxin-type protein NapF [Enterovibrio baiacu]|uniref:ferredoxin-type protein NapF n=1 Tax=Enterovibrio baiacu TaxID=2491023 RepID=UPI001010CBCB|nr:ferredoxin-type protein NapF [Enterovibrio baiacu]MBE1274546.1 ferredoxin-type protein NapF [Enterovibrio baiacu]
MVDNRRRAFMRTPFKHIAKASIQPLPWIKDVSTFTDDCSRCGECIKACETQIIKQGDGGFPTVDFTSGECTFCYACADACPEPLFLEEHAQPWQQAISIDDACLAKKSVECRSCADACETQAIRFRLSVGSVAQPQFNSDDCTGCGACLSPCPVDAITMQTNTKTITEQQL